MKSLGRWPWAVVLSLSLASGAGCPQVYGMAGLNAEQIRKLDRDKTVIIIPGGILEEHAKRLPSLDTES
jgi:hypothetical protein